MNLPDITVLEAHQPDGTPIEGLIFSLTVSAGTKNSYRIDFPRTDSSGQARLSAHDFRAQFEDHWEEGLMDYNGSVEEAKSVVRVSLFDTNRLRERRDLAEAWPLLKYERRKWRSRGEKIDYYLSAANAEYHFCPISWDLEAVGPITLKLEPRSEQIGGLNEMG